VSNGKLADEDRKAALARISGTTDINDMAPVDLVIEAATEDETVKRKIFAQLCPVLKPEALLATNTSSLSITRLAASLCKLIDDPETRLSAPMFLVDAHIDAIKACVRDDIRVDTHPIGRPLVTELEARVAEHLGPAA
jgi:hypothetical protein